MSEPTTDAPSRVEQQPPTAPTGPVIVTRSIGAFKRPEPGDITELIKDRYLCQGGGLILYGGTGLGKSSLAVQLPAQFALGRGDFGIDSTRPLRSLIIQSENDDGDIAEFRDGAYAGYGYSGSEINQIQERVWAHTETDKRGKDFLEQVVEPRLKDLKPDLFWMDHALAYFNGRPNDAEDVGEFLREWLNPLLRKYTCAAIILHHTPKPSEQRLGWSDRDYSYGSYGSVEWSGWARAVLSVEEVSDLVFLLRASKRGPRLKWRDRTSGKSTCRRYIAWSKDRIFWRTPEPSEIPTPKTAVAVIEPQDLLGFLIAAHPNGLRWVDWWKPAQAAFGGSKNSDKSFRVVRDRLRKENECFYDEKTYLWHLRPPGT